MITTGVRALLALGLKSMLSSFAAPGGRTTGWCVAEVDSVALAVIGRTYGRLTLLFQPLEMMWLPLLPLNPHIDLPLWQLDGPVGSDMVDTIGRARTCRGDRVW